MSDFPCTGCRSTANGRLTYFYVNYYADQELVKRRARLCQNCVVDVVPQLLEGADYQDEQRNWIPVERHVSKWLEDANSALTTNHAADAMVSLAQHNRTITSGEDRNSDLSNSARTVPSQPLPPQSQSSAHSRQQDSEQPPKLSRRQSKRNLSSSASS